MYSNFEFGKIFNQNLLELRKNKLWIMEDDKEYGFPFNRKWNFDPMNVINNQNRYLTSLCLYHLFILEIVIQILKINYKIFS